MQECETFNVPELLLESWQTTTSLLTVWTVLRALHDPMGLLLATGVRVRVPEHGEVVQTFRRWPVAPMRWGGLLNATMVNVAQLLPVAMRVGSAKLTTIFRW